MRPNQIAANLGAVRPWSDPVLDKHSLMESSAADLKFSRRACASVSTIPIGAPSPTTRAMFATQKRTPRCAKLKSSSWVSSRCSQDEQRS